MSECNMSKECPRPVTHIGSKGYVYCSECAGRRAGWERTRAMRAWERDLVKSGKPIPSYRPISRAEAEALGVFA